MPRYNHSAHSVFDYQYLKRKTHSVCECDYVLVGVSEREMHGNGAIESVLLPFSGFISFVGFLVYAVITALAPVFFLSRMYINVRIEHRKRKKRKL